MMNALRYRNGVIFVLVLAWIAAGCSAPPTAAPLPTATPGATATSPASSGSISANGVLAPRRRLELSFGAAGMVREVGVEVGQAVQAGQALASLDASEAQLAVQQAEAELAAAQADYNLAAAGLEAKQTSAALELLEARQARQALDENTSTARASALQEISQASRDSEQASYALFYLTMPASLADLPAVEALQQSREALERARADYRPCLNAASRSQTCDELKEKLDRVQGEYHAAERRMSLEAAQAQAQARLGRALADYQALLAGPDADQVALAEARLANAQAQLAQVASTGAPAGGGLDSLALAAAKLKAGEARLGIAQAQLKSTSIVAPLDGVVAAIAIDPGEWAAPGAAVIEILDLSAWRVETRNVGELQIGRVQIGQGVRVRANAFQGETLEGQVVSISPDSVTQQGEITYTLLIELEPTQLNLRPGMTARVEILTGE